MPVESNKGLRNQIETESSIELKKTVRCSGCGGEIDITGQPTPTQIINGIEVRGRAYCDMCKHIGALKEGWMPQSGGRVTRMFSVK